jgi:hypothetical protein
MFKLQMDLYKYIQCSDVFYKLIMSDDFLFYLNIGIEDINQNVNQSTVCMFSVFNHNLQLFKQN